MFVNFRTQAVSHGHTVYQIFSYVMGHFSNCFPKVYLMNYHIKISVSIIREDVLWDLFSFKNINIDNHME